LAFRNLETSIARIQQRRFYDGQRANYEFSGPFAYFKHHLSDCDQVAFSDAQDEEKKFAWPFDTLKHGFIDFTKVVF
jgi:hypothetical protein